jgi:transcriptional regulator with XRE-family HTH domain
MTSTTPATNDRAGGATGGRAVGERLRWWREHRRLSQLDLAIQADISARHLSFVETGRSKPSSRMILHLSEHLDVPLRDRNQLLLAGGFAPAYPEHDLDAVPMAAVRGAIRQVLTGHEPLPAAVIDRHWNLVDANAAIGLFTADAAPDLLTPPANVLRLSLHPSGLAPHIVNLGEWRAHLLGRLRRQAVVTADPVLRDLLDELRGYPCDDPEPDVEVPGAARDRSSSRSGCGWARASCRSSAPPPSSGRRWTSRWPSWPSSRSTRPIRKRWSTCTPAPDPRLTRPGDVRAVQVRHPACRRLRA